MSDLGKEHVWRSYDYPHVVMLYFHMYQIAKLYPEMSTYLDAAGYLDRAWETARAFYTYPYEIYPDILRDLQMGALQRARRPRPHRRAGTGGVPVAGGLAARRVGEEDQVFRLRRPLSVPLGVRLRPDGLRVDLRLRQVRRDARHGARQEPLVRPQAQEVVLASARPAGGLAGLHGPPARLGPRRPGLAQPGLLHARLRPGRQLHGGDGRLGRARLRAQLRAAAVRLARSSATRPISARGA